MCCNILLKFVENYKVCLELFIKSILDAYFFFKVFIFFSSQHIAIWMRQYFAFDAPLIKELFSTYDCLYNFP
jgi:hypothetical protein